MRVLCPSRWLLIAKVVTYPSPSTSLPSPCPQPHLQGLQSLSNHWLCLSLEPLQSHLPMPLSPACSPLRVVPTAGQEAECAVVSWSSAPAAQGTCASWQPAATQQMQKLNFSYFAAARALIWVCVCCSTCQLSAIWEERSYLETSDLFGWNKSEFKS